MADEAYREQRRVRRRNQRQKVPLHRCPECGVLLFVRTCLVCTIEQRKALARKTMKE